MTLFEVEELAGYWADHPPVHLMVAAYLGVKPAIKKVPTSAPVDHAAVLAALAPLGIASGEVFPGTPVFDLETLRRNAG
jgi:hypothetical protein